MRALTLHQPYATLVAIGAKSIETRGWPTEYRGPLAIHAAKTLHEYAYNVFFHAPCREVLAAVGIEEPAQLPLGVVVAVTDLVAVEPIDVDYLEGARRRAGPVGLPPFEGFFGDYTPGRFAWRLANRRRLPAPIMCRGLQGLWELPPIVHVAIADQLEAAPRGGRA